MKMLVDTMITKEETTVILSQLTLKEISKGAGIRALFAGGLSVKDISKATGIRYNHVYNVIRNEVLVNGLEVEQEERGGENSKKSQILAMLAEGKTITEVSRDLKVLYNYVWQIAKAAGFTKTQVADAKAEAAAEAEKQAESAEFRSVKGKKAAAV